MLRTISAVGPVLSRAFSCHWSHHESTEGAVFTSITSLHAGSRLFFGELTLVVLLESFK